jgi:hypothetical protein
MKLRVKEGTQVAADRVYAAGEEFDVPAGYEKEAEQWLALGFVEEVTRRLRRKAATDKR